MAVPAGPCEWCGGPQQWTIIASEMYVRCVAGCLGLFPEGPYDPPSDSEESLMSLEGAGEGTILRMGGVPLEGADDTTMEPLIDGLPF